MQRFHLRIAPPFLAQVSKASSRIPSWDVYFGQRDYSIGIVLLSALNSAKNRADSKWLKCSCWLLRAQRILYRRGYIDRLRKCVASANCKHNLLIRILHDFHTTIVANIRESIRVIVSRHLKPHKLKTPHWIIQKFNKEPEPRISILLHLPARIQRWLPNNRAKMRWETHFPLRLPPSSSRS